ncbi:ATP-binding cassette domain-containing protein [Paenibacillus sp. TRM 82003]|nr:ATP-binding cassette domain-containing protein [Paenibacillus sp. TRM 82003]
MATALIQLDDFTFRYPGAEQHSLKRVRLTIEAQDFVAIIGSNGSGKSTLCKTFNGLIPHFYNGDVEGEVRVMGASTFEQTVDVLSRRIGYVYQDFENQLVRPTVYDEITFAPINFGLADYHHRAERVLDILELGHLRNEYVWQLSGGQKHMVALAGVLALDPEVIVVDEPVAQLDPFHATLIYDKLKLLNERYGKTIVVIEHHTEFIAAYCKHAILMDQGSVRWVKPVREALNELDTLAALHILPPQVTQAAKRLGLPGDGLLPVTVDEAAEVWAGNVRPRETKTPAAEPVSGIRGSSVLRIEGLQHYYKTIDNRRTAALTNLRFEAFEGDRIALVGNNGAGKSTLLKMITGIIKPTQGEISMLGHNVVKLPPERIAEMAAYIYQNPEEMFIADHIREDIEYFLAVREEEGYRRFVDELIDLFRLKELQYRDGRLLSGGQQRRASLAVGMAMKPQLLLLDEPTASLDVSSRKEMVRMLELLQGRVKTVLVATHDMQLVAEWANRVVVMNQGSILADTDPRSLFRDEPLLSACGLKTPQIVEASRRVRLDPPALSVDEFADRVQMGRVRHEIC